MMSRPTAKTAVINYKSHSAGRSRQMALFAIAAFVVISPLPVIYPMLFSHSMMQIVEASFLALALVSLLFLLHSLTLYSRNRSSRLILTEEGLVLPGRGGKSRGVSWGQVDQISVSGIADSEKNEDREEINFLLSKGEEIRLKLASLSHEDLDKLVSGCDLWANKSSRDASFNRLVDKMIKGRVDSDQSSFTGIWMEEAQRRISTTPFVPLEPGTKLQDGRIKVLQPLTAGGWSAIYLCEWKNRTPVILKEAVVPPSANAELKAKAKEHFEREAVLLAGLDNPRIANVLDYFVEGGRQYMLLERINGSTLRTYVKDKGGVSERQALTWAREIADIVEYLHTRETPVVHRDLTPENLVLDMRGSLILVDFGAANEFVGTVTGTLVGKPSYISPEQFSGRANLQSDLYSLGAVLFYLLTATDPEPLSVNSPRSLKTEISESFDRLVQDLTELDLKKRIGSASELKERLDQLEIGNSREIIEG